MVSAEIGSGSWSSWFVIRKRNVDRMRRKVEAEVLIEMNEV